VGHSLLPEFFKPYPSAPLPSGDDELARLIEVHKVQAADVEKLTWGKSQMTTTLLLIAPRQIGSQFSMRILYAILLLRGKRLSEFSDQVVQEPKVQEMIGRINFYVRSGG